MMLSLLYEIYIHQMNQHLINDYVHQEHKVYIELMMLEDVQLIRLKMLLLLKAMLKNWLLSIGELYKE